MCVIPFDRERPFPARGRVEEPKVTAAALQLALTERALALALRENASNRERARRAEKRLDDLTAQMMRDQLAETPSTQLPKVG